MLAQMVKVQARLTKLRASVIAIKPPEGTRISYDLNVDIKQAGRKGAEVKLRYNIGIETFPAICRAEIAGTAVVNAEMLAQDENLEDLGEGVLGDIAVDIYRQNFEALYLALAAMGMDSPSPWLVKEAHLVNPARPR
ncbi:MAG: hypothetical protein JRN06_02955 [Nitrososphaerota archaeon]|nr:hypothetical protein [Nitrososphaerota archaeon]MDG7023183.1 hypothetical protein [Nitrososphaerota archaeon]